MVQNQRGQKIMSPIPQIQIGKSTEQTYIGIKDLLPLPANTPFGNFYLKFWKIVDRLDHVNRKIKHSHVSYTQAISEEMSFSISEHAFYIEEIIYWLRKSCDELISLISVLNERESSGKYPRKIKYDSIGRVLEMNNPPSYLSKHIHFLGILNEISNAYKHSFVNSDMGLIGREEPFLFALSLKQNNLSNNPNFTSLPIREVITHFDAFYQDAVTELRACKLPHIDTTAQ
jgi:hypothetical protein